MTFRDRTIHAGVLGVTALFLLLSLINMERMESVQYLLLALGTLLIGLPHGATDNYLYDRFSTRRVTALFYGGYLLVAILYGALWLLAPTFSLILFLIISIYHFGQSNLFYTDLPEKSGSKKAIYLSWGAFNLASPLLFRYQEAQPIIEYLIGYSPLSVATAHRLAPFVSGGLLLLNAAILLYLYARRRLAGGDLAKELLAFGLLYALYATAPLYVSFIVYWAFWHSLNSAIEIAETWDYRSAWRRLGAFYRSALPLTAVTLAGMAVVFFLADAYASLDALIGVFFVIIAAITLPHTVVMEMLYRNHASRTP